MYVQLKLCEYVECFTMKCQTLSFQGNTYSDALILISQGAHF